MTETDRPADVRILPRSEHPISRSEIDRNALKVLYRLHRSGFKAFLVGGSVRDLMLGRRPKDFDVATDARPEEVHRLFRNSRLIGRRFRLVHVYYRDSVVEVSTFRRIPDPASQGGDPDDLLITSDNTYGSPEEDAYRRDFGLNALFYNIDDFSVIDFVGGLVDLDSRLIRVIGEPDIRFQEDPVRMLRACEFAARLGFGIEQRTQEGITLYRKELSRASAVRVTDEILQLLRCGHAGAGAQWMLDLGLAEVILPEFQATVEVRRRGLGDFSRILPILDELVQGGRVLSDAVLLAVLLLPKVLLDRLSGKVARERHLAGKQLERFTEASIAPFVERLKLSRARTRQLLDALILFQGLGDDHLQGGRRKRFARRPGFRDAVQVLEIMVRATGEGHDVLDGWMPLVREQAPNASERRDRPEGRGRRDDSSGRPAGGRRRRSRGGRRRRRPGR